MRRGGWSLAEGHLGLQQSQGVARRSSGLSWELVTGQDLNRQDEQGRRESLAAWPAGGDVCWARSGVRGLECPVTWCRCCL